MTKKTCEACKWRYNYHCVRFPPQIVGEKTQHPANYPMVLLWSEGTPVTKATYIAACGEYAGKEAK